MGIHRLKKSLTVGRKNCRAYRFINKKYLLGNIFRQKHIQNYVSRRKPLQQLYFRYLSVNYPIKYRNHRKLQHVKIAMMLSWVVSAILWAPWILFWQFMTDKGRTVSIDNCYIQFIWDSNLMALLTAAGKLKLCSFEKPVYWFFEMLKFLTGEFE